MRALWNALGLLTRLPVGATVDGRPGAAAFGIVGAMIGALAAAPVVLLGGPAGEPWLGAFAAVATVTAVTGAFHLDGLADTADALLAPDTQRAERARTDPAVGPGGVVVLILVIGGEIAALASLTRSSPAGAAAALVAIVAVSRVVPVLAVRSIAVPTDKAGLGAWFANRVSTADSITAVVVAGLVVAGAAVLAAPAGPTVVAAALAAGIVGLGAQWAIAARRGRLDGDAMGAAIEISMVSGLSVGAILAP